MQGDPTPRRRSLGVPTIHVEQALGGASDLLAAPDDHTNNIFNSSSLKKEMRLAGGLIRKV